MVSAQSARDSALAVYDSFDDRYLGAKSSDPSVDNDGNPLITGALYFNTTSNLMKVYSGSTWVVTYATVTDVNLATQVTGTLGINNGGTGQTTANTAFNALAPSQTGNSGKYLSTDGSTTAWTNISSGSLLRVTVFTSSGTWTKGANTNYIVVQGVGGGAGGGGTRAFTTSGAGGGGGGGYFKKLASTSGITTATVTIGAGGAVQGIDGAFGNSGGDTTFVYGATTLTGFGGAGGAASVSGGGGGNGGIATNGDINIRGQAGMGGNYPSGTNGLPGTGGSSILGFGGPSNGNQGVKAATGYGAGGTGASGESTGGAGTSGIVIVEEYA
jgi:hypothetical protein